MVPEPPMKSIEGSRLVTKVVLSAVSGHSMFEFTEAAKSGDDANDGASTLTSIQFDETLMYQTRTFVARLTNTGAVRFPFSFQVQQYTPEKNLMNFCQHMVIVAKGYYNYLYIIPLSSPPTLDLLRMSY